MGLVNSLRGVHLTYFALVSQKVVWHVKNSWYSSSFCRREGFIIGNYLLLFPKRDNTLRRNMTLNADSWQIRCCDVGVVPTVDLSDQ